MVIASIAFFFVALWFTLNLIEFWARKAHVPIHGAILVSVAWTAFAWTQGLFII